MITQLTQGQKDRLLEFRERWIGYGLSTSPAEKPRAELAIRSVYEIGGLKPPKRIVWCGSPLSMCLTHHCVQTLRNSVGASVRDSVGASVRASVRDSVGDSVRNSVGASVRASVRDSVGDSVYGQHDAEWLGFYEFFREACGLKEQTEKLSGLLEIGKSAGWWLPMSEICWISERHSLVKQVMRAGRRVLHCTDGPAVLYPDGFGVWAINGVRLPRKVVENPQELTPTEIERERNVEVRRIMLERFGWQRFIQESGAKEVHKDDWGHLFRRELPGDEPIVMVKVTNATPEPDGTFKDYFLRVPPDMTKARQAVAWTFGQEEDYAPEIET